ncbi:MAG: MFS transporter [Gammaproteobacteria bacterium]|jgi:fucose permease|uniref:MFS transporter n=1 Tax=Marinomonas TaxID=28253 RepID=UPI000C1E117C|nr:MULTISPECIES: MFS transporter [unclassified Marinomonas]MBU2021345.1 MFS transporter [Gammaproteobacteria bacterium]MBU2239174.1 MFS transporter [Gammaproteobacteria bacterium]MBU2319051.1 MFS transporter [Gammaproteobacteria bacterium]MBU2412472.1 MFS transporter [Gammaproteobacteria bacterium]PJE55106.1 MFS transporter [Marinomonas sp. BSi20584]
MKELTRTALYCAMFIAVGAVAGLLGPSLIYLADLIDASVAEISIVFTARAIGNILGALLAGRMFDRWQGHHYLIVMLLCMITGLVLVPFSTGLSMLVVLFFLLGATEVSANAGGNMMMLWLHKEKVGSYVTILHLCHSAGSMLAPLILVFAQWTGHGYGAGYWMVALYALLLPLLLWRQPSPTFEVRASEVVPATKQKATFLAFLTVIFLYVGFEITIAGWISTYAVLSGEDQNTAAILVTWFFVSLSLGRLFSVFLLRWITPRQGIYGLLVVSFSGSLMMIFSDASLVVIALWLGLGCSAFFPMLFSYANSIMALNGKRTGYVFVCCGLGALVAPSLTGPIIEVFSAAAFPYLLLVLALLMVFSWQRLAGMTRGS